MPRSNQLQKVAAAVRLGGVEVSVSLDRRLYERLRSSQLYKGLQRLPMVRTEPPSEPSIEGLELQDIDWYQTIELGDGVVTPGFVDHRAQVGHYGIPESLEGKRCLDVATFDGFWAFEMERRGASEVVAIDLNSLLDCDIPVHHYEQYAKGVKGNVKGQGFAYAKKLRGSKVQRKVQTVYDLSPATVGSFDFVFLSDLLIHLRDPMAAIEAVRSVTRKEGEVIVAEIFDPALEEGGHDRAMRIMMALDEYSGCWWWYPTSTALKEMLRLARFDEIEEVSRLVLETTTDFKLPKVILRARGGAAV